MEISSRLSRLEGLVGAMGGEQAIIEKTKAMERERGRAEADDVRNSPREIRTADGGGEGEGGKDVGNHEDGEGSEHTHVLKADGGRYLSGDFWSNLSVEVSLLLGARYGVSPVTAADVSCIGRRIETAAPRC